jgi:hypothetical protein
MVYYGDFFSSDDLVDSTAVSFDDERNDISTAKDGCDALNIFLNLNLAVEVAHWIALVSIPIEDIRAGHLNFQDYLEKFVGCMWKKLPRANLDERLFYIASPRISTDSGLLSKIAGIYMTHSMTLPVGIECLPARWGGTLVDEMSHRRWRGKTKLLWKAVFGWKRVGITQDGYLNLHYPQSLPYEKVEWTDVCERLIALHLRLDPGPFSKRENIHS